MAEKIGIPRGTRDFLPEVMYRRQFIFNTLRDVFQKFGYEPLETPSMELLSVLTGKYGEEGDRLIFKILNSGDYKKEIAPADWEQSSALLATKLCEKALRYDLTVPFARVVATHKNELLLPFKRYQIQPVWRADNPQKGRYREFYQCDADVVGTKSLIVDAELIKLYEFAFQKLGLKKFTIHINHRGILSGIAEAIGTPERLTELCTILDKIDKIGIAKVLQELQSRNFSESSLEKLTPLLEQSINTGISLTQIAEFVENTEEGKRGINELTEVFKHLETFSVSCKRILFSPLLARGLNYYTGCIFEVTADEVIIGSIGGGGRYDNLTGVFGLPGISGVGISFGADRIYDVLQELNLFPEKCHTFTQVLITYFEAESLSAQISLLNSLRSAGICAEMFPEPIKLTKQFNYADKKQISHVCVIGETERQNNNVVIKNLKNGSQIVIGMKQAISYFQEVLYAQDISH
ncbi:MAG: histidine--tRNA ligase [Bacteroidia bacterium]|nr:histidine--tRNA ligase [Bacteroidia bacterium]